MAEEGLMNRPVIWKLIALICPLVVLLAGAPVVHAIFTRAQDSWGLYRGLMIMTIGIPLIYAAVPIAGLGLAAAIVGMRRHHWRGPAPIAALAANLVLLGAAGYGVVQFEQDKARRNARHEQVVRFNSLHRDLRLYADGHGGQLPPHLLKVRSIAGLQDEVASIDAPGWGEVSGEHSLARMPPASRTFVLDWVHEHSELIYLGNDLTIGPTADPHAEQIIVVIRREPLPGLGYPVLTLDGGTRFLSAQDVRQALNASTAARQSINLPPHDADATMERLR